MPRFSETLMDHAQSPRNRGTLRHADRVGVAGIPGRGRSIVLQLVLDGQRVSAAGFQAQGCGVTIAAASMLTELVIGKTLAQCGEVTTQQLAAALDGMPADKLDRAALAVAALHGALETETS